MERRIGVVRKFILDRGFGFFKVLEKRDDGKPARVDGSIPDVFLHIKELKRAGIEKVDVGATLEFDISYFTKGYVASKVALVQ
jgi:cold shock CspA family protein